MIECIPDNPIHSYKYIHHDASSVPILVDAHDAARLQLYLLILHAIP